MKGSFTSSLYKRNQNNLRKFRRRRKSNINNSIILENEGNLNASYNTEDQILVSQFKEEDTVGTPILQIPLRLCDGEGSSSSIVSDNRVEVVFPAPGLILNELFQLYNDK